MGVSTPDIPTIYIISIDGFPAANAERHKHAVSKTTVQKIAANFFFMQNTSKQ